MNTGKVIQLMNMTESERNNPNQGRVYSVDGISPTLTKMDGGGRQPFIVEFLERRCANKVISVYGLSRNRDKKGEIVKRNCNPYVNCIHTCVGGGHENMWVLVAEIYENTYRSDERTQ